jgi:hypothetical protein
MRVSVRAMRIGNLIHVAALRYSVTVRRTRDSRVFKIVETKVFSRMSV